MNFLSTARFLFLFIVIGSLNIQPVTTEASDIVFGRINKVKLYSDRAEVYRELKVRLSGNRASITVGPFPDKLIANSLRISPKDNSQVGNFQLERVFESTFTSQPIQKQNELVKKIQNILNTLRDDLSVYDDQIRFIEDMPNSRVASENSQDPDFWNSVLTFKASKGKTTRELRRKLNIQIQNEQDRLKNEKEKLKEMMAGSKKGHYIATLDINSSDTSETSLGIVYQIRNAGWRPAYQLHANNNKITLSYFAEIDQNTGEDWENISLELSTGQPGRRTQPPELHPWIVDFPKPASLSRKRLRSAPMQSMVMEGANMMLEAKVVESGTSYTFVIPDRQTISAGTRKFRALITRKTLVSELTYTVIPKLSKRVFLRAKLKNTSDFQWLPGQSGIYLDGSFVGNNWMKNTSPGEELKLGLGTDDSIRVERKLVKKEDGGEGFFGQKERARYIFEITLENFKKQSVKLVLKDQLPLPYHEDIKTKINRIEPKPDKTDKQNFLTWNLTLAPAEKKTIVLDFQVEYPKGKVITGL
ncbi:DUF4139 domain-containing protein [bacterium AH-315-C08]|nr:DUF4139 domain-containing protein [bacterium AH-315-C08]